MKYESEILECYDCEVVLRTELDLTDKESKRQFDALSERIKKVLQQIELHEDYEDLLDDKKKLNEIENILIDRMSKYADKKCCFEQKIQGEQN